MNEDSISRRPFIKTVVGAGFAASLSQAQEKEAAKDENGKKLGWAIVGLSKLSEKKLGPALQKTKHAHLAAIVTGTPEKAAKWQEKYDLEDSAVYSYEEFDEIIDNPEVDVVYIVLPNSMHREFTVRAARAGKHVYVEKPMAVTPEDCREMIAVCEDASVRLGVAYRLQYEPHHKELIRFARDKVFGEVRHINAGFGFQISDEKAWRLEKAMGGGALLDVGVYIIQAARYIFNEEPETVAALGTKIDDKKFAEVDETTTWTMRFPSGKTANLLCSYNLKDYDRLTVFANKGQFGLDSCFGFGGQKGWTSDPEISLEFPKTEQFEVQIDLFSQAITKDEHWKADGTDGLRDHLVMEAVAKSVASGKAETVGEV